MLGPLMDLAKDVATVIVAFTTIGSALVWVYKKLVVEPDNRLAQSLQDQNNRTLHDTLEPLTTAIDQLNINLNLASKEREELKKEVTGHDSRLDNHEVRITVLEKGGKT